MKIAQNARASNPDQSFEEALAVKIAGFTGGGDALSWIYQNDIAEVWKSWLSKENGVQAGRR